MALARLDNKRMSVKLTEEQQRVLNYFHRLSQETGDNGVIARLNAAAGTGKSTIVKQLFRVVEDIIVLCPTHKARAVYISDPEFRANSSKIMTIHRYLKATLEYDDLGEGHFVITKPDRDLCIATIEKDATRLIVVDEASMVNTEMYNAFVDIYRRTKRLSILFTGDPCQLPPVGEDNSIVFTEDILEFTLTRNMRSEESSDAVYVQNCRENVLLPDTVPPIAINNLVLKTYFHQMIDCFRRTQDEKSADCVVLTWTNKRKDYWNTRIRSSLFQKQIAETGYLERLYENETLVFSGWRSIPIPGARKWEPRFYTYYSSDYIVAKNVKKETLYLEYTPSSCQHTKGKKLPRSCATHKCDICGLIAHKKEGHTVTFYTFTDYNDTTWRMPATEADEETLKQLFDHTYRYNKTISKSLPNCDRKQKMWSEFHEYKMKYYPKLNYTYAMTVHMAQGSEWARVFVDWANIQYSKTEHKYRQRLSYTAVSRMRKRLNTI